jgi:hypothetical protein
MSNSRVTQIDLLSVMPKMIDHSKSFLEGAQGGLDQEALLARIRDTGKETIQ